MHRGENISFSPFGFRFSNLYSIIFEVKLRLKFLRENLEEQLYRRGTRNILLTNNKYRFVLRYPNCELQNIQNLNNKKLTFSRSNFILLKRWKLLFLIVSLLYKLVKTKFFFKKATFIQSIIFNLHIPVHRESKQMYRKPDKDRIR